MEKTDKRILVVDDDKAVLQIFTRILQKAGFTVDEAETANEAMEKLRTQTYDLALIDKRLPDMDGTELLGKIQTTTSRTIKMLITGYPSADNGQKALELGADAYLIKPIKPEELLTIIKEKLAKQETTNLDWSLETAT